MSQKMADDKGDYCIAFTQTVMPLHFLQKNPSYYSQFKDSWETLRSELEGVGNSYVVPEFTLNGQIHYHGMIEVKDRVKYFKLIRYWRKQLGHNLFKTITNRPEWEKYISKDIDVVKQLIKNNIDLPLFVPYNRNKIVLKTETRKSFFKEMIETPNIQERVNKLQEKYLL